MQPGRAGFNLPALTMRGQADLFVGVSFQVCPLAGYTKKVELCEFDDDFRAACCAGGLRGVSAIHGDFEKST